MCVRLVEAAAVAMRTLCELLLRHVAQVVQGAAGGGGQVERVAVHGGEERAQAETLVGVGGGGHGAFQHAVQPARARLPACSGATQGRQRRSYDMSRDKLSVWSLIY